MTKQDTITLELTAAQRNLLLKIQMSIPYTDVVEQIAAAVKCDGRYEIQLSPMTLEDLCGCLAGEANHATDEELEDRISEVWEHLEAVLSSHRSIRHV